MEQRFRSIVEELSDYAPNRNRDLLIEMRGQQVIASALNVLRLIRESYDSETADDLSKRLVRAIQSGDEEKFRRRVRAIREGKKKKD